MFYFLSRCQVAVANQNIKGLGLNLSAYLPLKDSIYVRVKYLMNCQLFPVLITPFFSFINLCKYCQFDIFDVNANLVLVLWKRSTKETPSGWVLSLPRGLVIEIL